MEDDEIVLEQRDEKEIHNESLDREFTVEEIVDALFALKTNSAAGSDSILPMTYEYC